MTLIFDPTWGTHTADSSVEAAEADVNLVNGTPTWVAGLVGSTSAIRFTPSSAYLRGPVTFWSPERDNIFIRFYATVSTYADSYIINLRDSADAIIATLRCDSAGGLRQRVGSLNIPPHSPAAGMLSTTPARVEWAVTPTYMQYKVFTGANLHGTVPDHDTGQVAQTIIGPFNKIDFGIVAGSGIDITFDEIVADDTTWAGPLSAEPVVTGMRAYEWDGTNLIPGKMYEWDGTNLIPLFLSEHTVTEPEPEPEPTGTIWADKFDTAADGQLTQTSGDALFQPTAASTSSTTYQHGSVVSEDGGKQLRHTIPANSQGALIVSPEPSRTVLHAKLEWESRFGPNFDWAWGGKMGPGLTGWAPGYGPYSATSGQADRDIGFSTRLMWHGRGASSGTRPFEGTLGPIPAERNMQVVTYIYARNPDGSAFSGYGYHENIGPEMLPSVWYKIAMEVKMNTVGQLDGIFRVWFDDVLAFEATNWDYRMRDDISIMAILYDLHRGGGSTGDWVSPEEHYFDVRNITLTELA